MPQPLICEKCHSRRLDPIKDKHHRWCKKCRESAFFRLQSGGATPDERRIRRVVPYGDYHAWLALYRAVMTGRVSKQLHVTKTAVFNVVRFRVGRS